MTGFLTLHADPTQSGHAATKQYVDAAVAAGLDAEEDGTPVLSGVSTLNFVSGFDLSDAGAGKLDISLDVSELDVVDRTTDQTISGTKTFLEPVVLASGLEPATVSATGQEGEIRWADDYIYVAVATDKWKRVAISNF
jgi:hypothetical protein